MMRRLKNFLGLNKPKSYFVNDRYKVVPAFRLNGVDYFMFESPMQVPSGRQLAALALYEEMNMRIDREYMEKHTAAMDKVLSDPRKINIGVIAQLNQHLKERLELLPLQEQVLKFATVIFFTEEESLFGYDYEYNKKKLERWKRELKGNKNLLDFFLSTPLAQLIPSLNTVATTSETYLGIQQRINEIHQQLLSVTLSGKASENVGSK